MNSSRPPHVVMLVGNDVSTDARVRREALAVAELGARVTVVGLASGLHRQVEGLDSVVVERVPVTFERRDLRALGLKRRREPRRIPGLANSSLQQQFTRLQRKCWREWDTWRNRRTNGAQWRDLLPEVLDLEQAFVPVVIDLAPDVVHAHDVQMVSVAIAVSAVLGCKSVYDAHEYVKGLSQYGSRGARTVAAWASLEREYIHRFDRVITVSEPLAEALARDYQLASVPEVVLNIPASREVRPGDPDVRSACGLALDVPLLVYSGGVQRARGVDTAIRALTLLPDYHLAVVCVPSTAIPAVDVLRGLALAEGLVDRVHWLEPVPHEEVAGFLRTADVGVIPLRHFPSHEMALTNKLFEYLQAGLPVVVSDCLAQRDFVLMNGIGAVHRAEDPADLASALGVVSANRMAMRARVADPDLQNKYSWPEQVWVLQSVYLGLIAE